MSKNINWLNRIKKKATEDNIIINKINNIHINELCKINRDSRCKFICPCGKQTEKNIRQIIEKSGFYCEECTSINREKKMNKIKWTEERLKNYFSSIIFWYNFNLIKYTKKSIKDKWEIPNYNWWRRYHSNWAGSLSKFKVKFQNLLDLYGKRTKRTKKSLDNEEDLINAIKIIYEKDGIEGLIPINLNNNHGSIYSRCIRSKKNTNKIKVNYPCIWCCEKINIIDEYKKYIKTTFPIETETFLELCELHIKPFLENIKTNINGFILDYQTFYNNNGSSIVKAIKKHKSNINDVRQHFKLSTYNLESLRKNELGFYEKRNSKAEIVFDNFLILYTDLKRNEVEWEGYYPDDFRLKYKKKCKYDCHIKTNNLDIIIEIWGYNYNTTSKIGIEYIKKRKMKEDYWKTKKNIVFIGIEHDQLYSNSNMEYSIIYLKKLLSSHIKINEKSNFQKKVCFPNNVYITLLNICKDSIIQNDGKLYIDKLNLDTYHNNMLYKLGGLSFFREKLHGKNYENLYDNKSINQFPNSFSPEEKERIKAKTKLTIDSKSPEEKEKIKAKIRKTRKERGLNLPENNPMFGKKGKNNKNYGQKRKPKISYEDKYLSLIVKFITGLENDDKICGECEKWINFTEKHNIAKTPWNNPNIYNPWKKTKFKGFIESGINYCKINNIQLNNFKYDKVISKNKRYKKYTDEDIFNAGIDAIIKNNIIYLKDFKIFVKEKYPNIPSDFINSKYGSEHNKKTFGTNWKDFYEKIKEYK